MAPVNFVALVMMALGAASAEQMSKKQHSGLVLHGLQAFADDAHASLSLLQVGISMTKTATGDAAPLTEDGYQQVVALRNDAEMKTYIYRVLEENGKQVTLDDNLNGFVPWFSGTTAAQSLWQMQQEIETKEWIVAKPVTPMSLLATAVTKADRAQEAVKKIHEEAVRAAQAEAEAVQEAAARAAAASAEAKLLREQAIQKAEEQAAAAGEQADKLRAQLAAAEQAKADAEQAIINAEGIKMEGEQDGQSAVSAAATDGVEAVPLAATPSAEAVEAVPSAATPSAEAAETADAAPHVDTAVKTGPEDSKTLGTQALALLQGLSEIVDVTVKDVSKAGTIVNQSDFNQPAVTATAAPQAAAVLTVDEIANVVVQDTVELVPSTHVNIESESEENATALPPSADYDYDAEEAETNATKQPNASTQKAVDKTAPPVSAGVAKHAAEETEKNQQ